MPRFVAAPFGVLGQVFGKLLRRKSGGFSLLYTEIFPPLKGAWIHANTTNTMSKAGRSAGGRKVGRLLGNHKKRIRAGCDKLLKAGRLLGS
jgi:hypothetical protein